MLHVVPSAVKMEIFIKRWNPGGGGGTCRGGPSFYPLEERKEEKKQNSDFVCWLDSSQREKGPSNFRSRNAFSFQEPQWTFEAPRL